MVRDCWEWTKIVVEAKCFRRRRRKRRRKRRRRRRMRRRKSAHKNKTSIHIQFLIIIITVSCEVLGFCSSKLRFSLFWDMAPYYWITGVTFWDIVVVVFKGQMSNGNITAEDEKNGY